MTEGAQTINGDKTFNGSIKFFGDTEIGLIGTATNLFGTGALTNKFGDEAKTSNTFGNNVSGGSAFNEFGKRSRQNFFGHQSNLNYFGAYVTGANYFGAETSGSTAFNNFGTDLKSGAVNQFGANSKNYFGNSGQNYFYSGLFAGPVTMPATVSYTSAGQIVKAGNHTLGLTTTANTTGTFPTGNINIAALEGIQTFAGEKTFSSGINILKTTDQLVLGSTQKTTITAPTPASARTYTIPDAGTNASFVMNEVNQTIGGTKTFTTGVVLQNVSNQLAFRTGSAGTNTITFTAPNISGNRTYTIPDVSGDASFVMTTGTQTIGGLKTFTTRPTVNGSGVFLSGEAVPGAYTAYSLEFQNGLRLTNGGAPFTWNGNQSKTVEIDTSAIASLTGSQTLNGTKTFNNGIIINTGSNQLQLGTTNKLTITTNPTSSRTYTIPDVGGDADFVMTSGSQNITGTKTFASQLIVTTGSNQLVLRTGSAGSNSFTISAPTISGNRTYTLPDVNGNASFIMSSGTQTMNGGFNFTTRPTLNGVNLLAQGDTSIFTRVEATNLVYNTGEQVISGRKRFRNASIVPYGPFVNDVDADFNGLLSSREIYFTDDGSIKSAIDIPTLDIVYETGATTLTPRIGPTPSFSRTQTNTSGSYLDRDGYIKYTTSNQPRFDYALSKNLYYGNPNTTNSINNFWKYPEFFVGFTDKMIEVNSEINPFKSRKDAAKFIDITGSGVAVEYTLRRDIVLNSGFNYTMSVFAKPINNNFIILNVGGASVHYNLSNGSISGIEGSITSSGIDGSYGNGWSRLWFSTAYNSATAGNLTNIRSSNSTGARSKVVTTRSDAFYLWGPQFESGSSPTQFEHSLHIGNINNDSFVRNPVIALTPKGLLLEKGSTNLVLNSNNFSGGAGTPNNFYVAGTGYLTGGAWPDGSGAGVSGFVFSEDSTIANHNVYRHPISNITSGTNYVSSIFLNNVFDNNITGRRYIVGRLSTAGIIPDTRVVIDLDSGISGGRTIPVIGYATPTFYTGIRYPNNWYRLIIGQTATGNIADGASCSFNSTTGFGVDIGSYSGIGGPAFKIFGHQIETALSGDSATSYKPTVGTSGLLGRDTFKIEGNDFSGFYNQNEGTFFIETELLQNNANSLVGMMGIESANRPSGNYSITRSTSDFRVQFSSGPPNYQLQASFSKTTGSRELLAIASYKENNFKTSFYNETIQTDTSGKLGSQPMNKIVFGANGEDSGPQDSSIYLKRFSYWPLQFQNNKLTGIYRY
jgi:hypothetical protein